MVIVPVAAERRGAGLRGRARTSMPSVTGRPIPDPVTLGGDQSGRITEVEPVPREIDEARTT